MMHQRVSDTDYQLVPAIPPPRPGEVDLWQLDLLEEGGERPCRRLRTFLYYLCSSSTYAAAVEEVYSMKHMADIRLFGPKADDGLRLYIFFVTTRKQCKDFITETERQLLSRELGRLARIGRKEKLGKWAASTTCSVLKLPMPPSGV